MTQSHFEPGSQVYKWLPPFHYLVIPGYLNSGEGHWQTIWESLYPSQFTRVQQQSWDYPDKISWVNTLDEYVQKAASPVILVAHSLGCIATVQWANQYPSDKIAGAFLVAPADAEKSLNPLINAFAPVPIKTLPFSSVVIASSNDPFASILRQKKYAEHWGSEFICVGDKGHINITSGIGGWKEGLDLLLRQFHNPLAATNNSLHIKKH